MKARDAFIRRFRELQPKYPRLCACHLTEADLTLSQFILLNLMADSGTMPMTEVSEKLHITKPAVTHLVDQLEKNKYLKRQSHPTDRRVYLLEIQPKGEKFVNEMQSALLRPILRTWEKLNSKEQKTVSDFYALLSQAMDEDLEDGKGKAK